MGTSGKIVWDLVAPLLHQGYHLYVANFVPAFRFSATIISSKKCSLWYSATKSEWLPTTTGCQKAEKGESATLQNEEILTPKWKDVYVLSSNHQDISVEIQRQHGSVQKPDCIHNYNQFMGGVD